MLNRARFAFAIMTPDDVMKDGTMRVRQNVVHEIGLCQARLGVRNTAILIANGTDRFTNVGGIVHLAFETGRIAEKSAELRGLLEERGILTPAPPATG
jgi:predicted nucleotide-binding protein